MPDITPTELFSHLATFNYETSQREIMNNEKSQNVALITQSTYEKKETYEVTEEALAVKNMSRYVAK